MVSSLKGLEKLWVAASAGCTVLGAVTIGRNRLVARAKRMRGYPGGIDVWDWLLYAAVLITNYFFWRFRPFGPLIDMCVCGDAACGLTAGYIIYMADRKKEKIRLWILRFQAGALVFLMIGSRACAGNRETAESRLLYQATGVWQLCGCL